jgi:hypothetical protein
MSLVELARCESRVEAAMLQSRLESEGVASFLFDAEMSWVGLALQCRVMVSEDSLAQAKRIMDEAGPEA